MNRDPRAQSAAWLLNWLASQLRRTTTRHGPARRAWGEHERVRMQGIMQGAHAGDLVRMQGRPRA